ncbi:MAG: hypothetical protein AB8B52_01185 [Winogradskyella sp.]
MPKNDFDSWLCAIFGAKTQRCKEEFVAHFVSITLCGILLSHAENS